MKARTATPDRGLRDQLAADLLDRARRYYPGLLGLDPDDVTGLHDDLAALDDDLDPRRLRGTLRGGQSDHDLDPAGWITTAVLLTAGAPVTIDAGELVGRVPADPRRLSGRQVTIDPDGTIRPAGPRPTRRTNSRRR